MKSDRRPTTDFGVSTRISLRMGAVEKPQGEDNQRNI